MPLVTFVKFDFIGHVPCKILEQMMHHWKARTSIFLLKQQKRAWHHQGICQPLELKKFDLYSVIQARVMPLSISLHLSIKGSFKNYVDIIFWFFDHPTTSVVIFYVPKMEKNSKFLTRYPLPVVHMVFVWPLTLLRAFHRRTVVCIWEFTPGWPGSRFLLPFLSPLN